MINPLKQSKMTKRQKFILDGLVNQWNDILMEWIKTGKTDMQLKKTLDKAYQLVEDYEKEIGLTDDDYFSLMIK